MTKTDQQAGLRQLLAIRDGTAPPAPIQELLDFDLVAVTQGTATFRYRPDARHLNPLGTVHGGVAMTLLDSAAGAATSTCLILNDSGRGQPANAAAGSVRAGTSQV